MPAVPFWEETPDPWDTLILGNLVVPGITEISGRLSRKVDTRSPPGGDGARVRDKGYEPAQLEARNRCWTAEQLEQLQALLAAVHPRIVRSSSNPARSTAAARRELNARTRELAQNPQAGNIFGYRERLRALSAEVERLEAQPSPRPTRTPFDCAHPQLALLGIRSVYVTGMSVPALERGVLVTTLNLLEWTEVPAAAPRPATRSEGIEGLETAIDRARDESTPRPTPPARILGRTGRVSGGGAGGLVGGG